MTKFNLHHYLPDVEVSNAYWDKDAISQWGKEEEISHISSPGSDPFRGVKARRFFTADADLVEIERGLISKLDPTSLDWCLEYSLPAKTLVPTNAVRLGIECPAISIEASSATLLYALGMANDLMRNPDCTRVGVVGLVAHSRLVPKTSSASATLADAAVAIDIGEEGDWELLGFAGLTAGEFANAVTLDSPTNKPWYSSDQGLSFSTRDPELAKSLAETTVTLGARLISKAAKNSEVSLARLSRVLVYQPGNWLGRAVAQALDLPPTLSFDSFERRGNIGACAVFENLGQLEVSQGDLVALFSCGAGGYSCAAIVQKT